MLGEEKKQWNLIFLIKFTSCNLLTFVDSLLALICLKIKDMMSVKAKDQSIVKSWLCFFKAMSWKL